jgi:hypothetical protein
MYADTHENVAFSADMLSNVPTLADMECFSIPFSVMPSSIVERPLTSEITWVCCDQAYADRIPSNPDMSATECPCPSRATELPFTLISDAIMLPN